MMLRKVFICHAFFWSLFSASAFLQFNGHEFFTVRRKWRDCWEKSGNEQLTRHLRTTNFFNVTSTGVGPRSDNAGEPRIFTPPYY